MSCGEQVTVASLFVFLLLGGQAPAPNTEHETIAKDGEYVGLEKMPNLTPDDRYAAWFHENTLVIRNDEAILDKVPVTIRHGKKTYSASDGGFLTYRAKFTRKDGQSFVSLRLFESDYVAFPIGKHDQYTEIKTYPVTIASGQVEFDGVRYKLTKVSKIGLERLLHALSTEPLQLSLSWNSRAPMLHARSLESEH